MPQGPYLRKYGAQATVDFTLLEVDAINLKTDAAHTSGDTKIMKDEGVEANTENGFTDEGQGYSIVLSAGELSAARTVIYVVDQGTKTWLDTSILVETYGNASAMHAFDLDTAFLASIIEGTTTLQQAMAIILAALAGKSTGGGTANIAFRDVADSKNRIAATVDTDGNRTAITIDGS